MRTFFWKGGLRPWQRNWWDGSRFRDTLGTIRACVYVDVSDPIEADIMLQGKTEAVLVEELLNKQGGRI